MFSPQTIQDGEEEKNEEDDQEEVNLGPPIEYPSVGYRGVTDESPEDEENPHEPRGCAAPVGAVHFVESS